MNEESNSLMPVGRGELARATGVANPLVARGLAEVAKIDHENASLPPGAPHWLKRLMAHNTASLERTRRAKEALAKLPAPESLPEEGQSSSIGQELGS